MEEDQKEITPTTPQSMYDSEGKIRDKGKAEKLAYLEKPARDREAEFKRREETELTREQKNNITIMDGLQEKYPKAFEVVVDNKGRKILTLDFKRRGFGVNLSNIGVDKLLITQEGIFGIAPNRNPFELFENQNINFAGMMDAIIQKSNEPGKFQNDYEFFEPSRVLTPERSGYVREVGIRKINLLKLNKFESENLKAAFLQSQEINVAREGEHARKEPEAKIDPQKILADL